MRLVFLAMILLAVVACQAPAPTPDIPATIEATVQLQTAPPNTATPYPTFTPFPTPTDMPTATAYPTHTPYPTNTPFPTPTEAPTATPYPTHTPYPTNTPYPTTAPNLQPTSPTALPIDELVAVTFGCMQENPSMKAGFVAGMVEELPGSEELANLISNDFDTYQSVFLSEGDNPEARESLELMLSACNFANEPDATPEPIVAPTPAPTATPEPPPTPTSTPAPVPLSVSDPELFATEKEELTESFSLLLGAEKHCPAAENDLSIKYQATEIAHAKLKEIGALFLEYGGIEHFDAVNEFTSIQQFADLKAIADEGFDELVILCEY